jgi:hypothetical protein
MQRHTVWLMVAAVAGGLGCGGGGAGSGAAAPGAPANAQASAAPAAEAPPAPPADTGPTTTTTALPDGGAAGAKLPEVTPAPSGSAGAAPKGAHTHDPGRGPEDIRAIVVSHRDEARACYDRALPDHPGIEGDLVIQWTIDPKGAVTQAAVDTGRSKITEPSVVNCVIGIVQKIQFAASPGGFETKAHYPFNFHPHHGKQP